MELKRFLNGVFARETETSLSRREALAGLSLAGALLAAPALIASRPAEAKPLDQAAEADSSRSARDTKEKAEETQLAEAEPAGLTGSTDLSSRRHWRWRRRHWRRHWGWRRRHWRRHYWRRRYWRHRHWRRRYWW